jgi:5-formyltetrahydrofolate cyclo-ligase
MQDDKAAIRRKALQERRAMPSEEYEAHSIKLSDGLIKLLKQTKPARIATFIPKVDAHEPDIRPAIEAAWALGIEVMVPRWSPKSPDMTFLPISSWEDVVLDDQGYLQPHGVDGGDQGSRAKGAQEKLKPQTPDVMWIPAVALDTQGGRIGYGKGYFDRAMNTIVSANPQWWSICFSSWVFTDPLPQEAHDQTVHRIITENGILEV